MIFARRQRQSSGEATSASPSTERDADDVQDTLGNSARAALYDESESQAEGDAAAYARSIRSSLGSNSDSIDSLDALTASDAFGLLDGDDQLAILEAFHDAPNGATAVYLEGLAELATHYGGLDELRQGLEGGDLDTLSEAQTDDLLPDSGELTVGGTTYTIADGVLQVDGQERGRIFNDGSYALDGGEHTDVYEQLSSEASLEEDGQDLLTLHDADYRGVLWGEDVNPELSQRMANTLEGTRSEGVDATVFETHRSMERQDSLYAQGRSAPGRIVTNVRGGGSWHNYGLAADVIMYNEQGTPGWHNDAPWDRYGAHAEANGLEWGGNWSSFVDLPHSELSPDNTRASSLRGTYDEGGLAAVWDQVGYGALDGVDRERPGAGPDAWQPVQEGKRILERGSTGPSVSALQNLLVAAGHDVEVDGIFGPGTDAAVRAFQAANGLTVDGVVGRGTAAALDTASSSGGGTQEAEEAGQESEAEPVAESTSSGTTGGSSAETTGSSHSASATESTTATSEATSDTESTTAATSTAPSLWDRVRSGVQHLARGAAGAVVGWVQGLLNRFGAGLKEDGDFGPKTEQAVRDLQEAHGLTVDGIVGPETSSVLENASTGTGEQATDEEAAAPADVAAGHGTYEVTSWGLNVRAEPTVREDNKIAVLTRGDQVEVLDIASNGWLQIEVRGQLGWISGKYATKVS